MIDAIIASLITTLVILGAVAVFMKAFPGNRQRRGTNRRANSNRRRG
ncbi:MAG TPA: hypothetical protein VFM18_16995 [Methanosarcina sp.]|nr:hypothetical protein [Methanosarcina sp.]